jgi:catechol 2,3-dioxygenase
VGAISEGAVQLASGVRPLLTHAAIYVWNLPRMAAFYESVLGLVRTDEGKGTSAPVEFIFFTNDASEHHQFVLVTGRPPEATFSVVNQLSFLVHSLAEVREVHRRAVAVGARIVRQISHGNAWSVYIEDPEGNQVEVYTHTPWYVPQPHAEVLDLTRSDEQIYRETEAACRRDPGFCTREEWMARTSRRLRG